MLEFILVFCAGLVVGWNVIEQPAWVKDLWDKYINKN